MKICVPPQAFSFTYFVILMDVSADLIVNQHNIWLLVIQKHPTEGMLVCRISESWGICSAGAGGVLGVGDPGDS